MQTIFGPFHSMPSDTRDFLRYGLPDLLEYAERPSWQQMSVVILMFSSFQYSTFTYEYLFKQWFVAYLLDHQKIEIFNPFTPNSDQFQVSPAGSPEI